MTVTYSRIKDLTEPEAMAAFLATRIIQPALPAVHVKKVRTKEGRRFEAPRILWNVYEAVLEFPGGLEVRRLFWTKAFFRDDDCEAYRERIEKMPSSQDGDPLDVAGHVRFFPELNLFLFFFPADPAFPALVTAFDASRLRPLLEPISRHLKPETALGSVTPMRVKYLPEISCIIRYELDVGEERPLNIYGKIQHSRRGQLTYEVMKALWNLPARASGDLLFSEPLGYYPEYDLLLQSEVRGEEIEGDRRAKAILPAWIQMLDALEQGELTEDFVDWFEIQREDGRDADVGLKRHWIDPTKPLSAAVLEPAHGALITSATLRDTSNILGGEGDHWASAEIRTGAGHLPQPARRANFDSPFRYDALSRLKSFVED